MNRSIWAAAAAALLFSVPAIADDRSQVLESFGKCAGMADDKARLACYDALAPQVRDALSAPPPMVASAPYAPTEQEQKSWFGFDVGALFGTSPSKQTTPQQFGSDQIPQAAPPVNAAAPAQPAEVDSITAGVTDYAFTPFGKFIVFLDNGQVWRQEEGDTDRAHFAKNPKDNTVTISRGFLGSYNLTVNDSGNLIKVKRVK
jgi:hypothetical protein